MTATRQPRRLEDFRPLSPAEQKVLEELDTGHVTVLGDGTLPPPDAGPDRRLRARFVRWCALGAGDGWRVHETGLRVKGALIVSDGEADPAMGVAGTAGLDLEGCKVEHDLTFFSCRFGDALVLRSARMAGLFLNGSWLPGMKADRLVTTGGIFLNGASAIGEVRLTGARIGRNLDCTGATLRNKGRHALYGDGLTTSANVFLRGARIEGEVRLLGARIENNLDCDGTILRNKNAASLNADECSIKGVFFWRKGASAEGVIDLSAAEIGAINDDPACWPGEGDILLNRCRYGAFTGKGIDGEERIRWLGLQKPSKFGKDFWPQPWEQCAKVLREMGHPEDARLVLIDKERRQRADRRRRLEIRLEAARTRLRLARASAREVRGVILAFGERLRSLAKESGRDAALFEASVSRAPAIRDFLHARDLPEGAAPLSVHREEAARRLGLAPDHALAAAAPIPGLWLALNAARFWDAVTGATIAYGRRPLRAFWWLLGLWLFGAFWFWGAYEMGSMKPANALVLRSAEWVGCAEPPQRQTACYLETDQGKSYPEFNALIYSADVLVPVVEIEQQAHWTPDEDKRWGAWFFRPLMYAKIILGWALSLLAVAGFSGLVKSD